MRQRIGYMPEERGLYPKMRVRDHLVYLARLHGAARQAATAAADRWLDALAIGDRAGDRVEALSLGNQQRVQLAAALVHDPIVLVLDEPFSGLDPVGVDVLAAVLRGRVDDGAAGGLLQPPARAGRAAVRRGRDHPGRPDGRHRHRAPSCGRPGASGCAAAAGCGCGWTPTRPGPPSFPGARVSGQDEDGLLIDLDPGADDQAVLAAARAAGPVRAFTPLQPTLTELFREVVGA